MAETDSEQIFSVGLPGKAAAMRNIIIWLALTTLLGSYAVAVISENETRLLASVIIGASILALSGELWRRLRVPSAATCTVDGSRAELRVERIFRFHVEKRTISVGGVVCVEVALSEYFRQGFVEICLGLNRGKSILLWSGPRHSAIAVESKAAALADALNAPIRRREVSF